MQLKRREQEIPKVLFLDWSHKSKKLHQLYLTDKKPATTKLEKILSLPKGTSIYVENLPLAYSIPLHDSGKNIFTCSCNAVVKYRAESGLPPLKKKTNGGEDEEHHTLDALILKEMFLNRPAMYRPWKKPPEISKQYSALKVIEKTRQQLYNQEGAFLGWATKEQEKDAPWKMIINRHPDNFEVTLGQSEVEDETLARVKAEVSKYKIATKWLLNIKGIAEKTAAGLISFIDRKGIDQFMYISHLWSYAGLGAPDQRRKKGVAGNWNSKFRAFLLGVIGDSFIKQRTEPYRSIYDKKKQEFLSRGKTLGHAHAHGRRVMMKIYLSHLWVIWRQLEGLPTAPAYVYDHLGHQSYIYPPCIPEELMPFEFVKEGKKKPTDK